MQYVPYSLFIIVCSHGAYILLFLLIRPAEDKTTEKSKM